MWITPPTRAIWIPPATEHEIEVKGQAALRTLYVSPERARGTASSVRALEVVPLFRELILHVVSIAMLDPLHPEHERLAAVLMDLIGSAREMDLVLPLPRDPRALRLAQALRCALGDKQSLGPLVIDTGASLRTLQRCFVEETGLTIESWRQKARLVSSAAELSLGASVLRASAACGYESSSAFSAAFRKQFGVTPRQFRLASHSPPAPRLSSDLKSHVAAAEHH